MKEFNDRVAVITGAASGMGRCLAVELAKLGAHLALADINEEGLRETAESARQRDRKITIQRVDVGDRKAVYDFAASVRKEHGRADLLINNAGVSTGFEIEYVDLGYFESVVNINFWGVVYGCKAFLPMLKERPEAHIVNVSSLFAIGVPPRHGAYSAAKAAVRAFTETLAAEFIIQKIPIHVSCVFPGAIKTNIAQTTELHTKQYIEKYGYDLTGIPEEKIRAAETQGATLKEYFKDRELTPPDEAARAIIEGIRKDAPRILVGRGAREVDELVRKNPDDYLWGLPEFIGPEYFLP